MILDKILDKVTGKLEKMIIIGYKTAEEAVKSQDIKFKDDDSHFAALINPESYTINYKVNLDCGSKAVGKTVTPAKFLSVGSQGLEFKFLFDDTGIIDGKLRDILKKPNAGIFDDVQKFRKLLMGFNGEAHQTPVQKLVWGKLIFLGRATDMTIEYKMFSPDGTPIRAEVKVKFEQTEEDEKASLQMGLKSPDLTHIRQVKAGDTLPLMCKKIYGDPKYYFQVAAANSLGNFRRLEPGMELIFPPIDKTAN